MLSKPSSENNYKFGQPLFVAARTMLNEEANCNKLDDQVKA